MRTRTWPEVMAAEDERWFEPALARLRSLNTETDPRLAGFFPSRMPVYVARAPGRLDVMGGIADYSGSLVLQLPLERATWAILQQQNAPRCELATWRDGRWQFFSTELRPLVSGDLREPEALAAWFAAPERHADRWAAQLVGVLQLCLRQAVSRDSVAIPGFRLLIDSTVPEGRGVASSASLQIAGMAAISAGLGSDLLPAQQAVACQWVENHIVGAPCGIMDQMTSACGRRDRLLKLRCQPGSIEGFLDVPPGYRFYGVDSGVVHAVSGADYTTVRTAAFMGYRMIADAAGLPARREGHLVRVDDARWGGYLANVSPAEFASRFAPGLPPVMSGSDFLARYHGTGDEATQVRGERRYPVRQATAHPVYEHERVTQFSELLGRLTDEPSIAIELGRLMYASHQSYSACGLGSVETDRLVELVASAGSEQGLFGAKITGGGSGGTVAVFGTVEAEARLREIVARYEAETGRRAGLFSESGPGAAETGVLMLDTPGVSPQSSVPSPQSPATSP
jgi:L-arabinokinase